MIRVLGFLAALLPALFAAAPSAAQADRPLRLVHAPWASSVASGYLICAIVERHLDRRCEIREVNARALWSEPAAGHADAMLSAWLPDTHGHYAQEYGEQLRDLGPNFEGTRTGLVVPAVRAGRQTGGRGARGRNYIDAQSIADLRGQAALFDGRIIGIEPEAGIMRDSHEALTTYGLEGFRLVAGSESTMTEILSDSIRRQAPVVATGWRPHWMFGRWALRFLDDPKGVYGGEGAIHTLIWPDLADEMPRVIRLLDRFQWNERDLGQLMVWIAQDQGRDPYGKAVRWMETHPQQIQEWLE